MRRSLLLLPLVLFATAAAPATHPSAAPAAERPALTRLAWGSVNLLVHADTTNGVHVWAATTSTDRQLRAPGRQRDFNGRFDPTAVERWTEAVAALLHAQRFAEGDTASAASALLMERDSAVAGVFRRREGDRLSERVYLFFAPPDGREPLIIQGEAKDALAFANAVLFAATLSRVAHPDSASTDGVYHDNPIDAATCVQIERAPSPRYPPELQAVGLQGEVWAYFVVDSTGRVDPASFDPLLTDHDLFTESVRKGLRSARFRPATRDGRPVNALVAQRFIFSTR